MPRRSDAPVSFRPARPAGTGATPWPLPRDLLSDVRKRVRLLALFMLVAFGFDFVVFVGKALGTALGFPVPAEFIDAAALQGVNAAVIAMSIGLWWIARAPAVSEARLQAFGWAYEVVICFIIAGLTNWQFFAEHGVLPNLTWVPAIIILFPLLLPGPPRQMLAAAVAAGLMPPLALLSLQTAGLVQANSDAYVQAGIASAFAVGFANLGARVVHGLGRQVAAAREMGSYQLEAKLGQGGMGEVWRARHRMLARPAAVKLIRPASAGGQWSGLSDDARNRFEREAQAIAQLRSPHTVELFDFGVADDGTVYYVMELLDGLDADTLVRRHGPLPVERVVHLLRQVCHSLSEAESRGLVHRDIKPANIFVCRYGEDVDFVKVLDFGLVKTLGAAPAAETVAALTRDDVIAGTPAYMAPEQAMGLADVDGRADIYAVGCVAYWLLTGQQVFQADNAVGQLMQHVQRAPEAPSARSALAIPAEVDRVILSCLAKDPADRPQSSRDLSRSLAALRLDSAWTDDRARQWWHAQASAAM